jgi:hypothetical protein
MNKKVQIFIGIIVILLVGSLLYLKINPPLDILGVSANAKQAGNDTNIEENQFVIVANPENKGFSNIRLKEVIVNSNEKPNRIELGVGRSNYMVMVTHALGNMGEGISFHEKGEYPIKPLSTVQSEEVVSDTIKHYGIAVFHDEKINNLVVKYSYLGIPFEKELDLRED